MRYPDGSICGQGSLTRPMYLILLMESLVSADPDSFPNIRIMLVLECTLLATFVAITYNVNSPLTKLIIVYNTTCVMRSPVENYSYLIEYNIVPFFMIRRSLFGDVIVCRYASWPL